MKLEDLKISTQLRLGLGAILALVVLLGALASVQTRRLGRQAIGLYDHPLPVRQALGRLEVGMESMSRHVRDLFLAHDVQGTMESLHKLEAAKGETDRQLAVLHDRYLGPPEDIAVLRDDFVAWHALRDGTVRLLREGKTTEAEARILPGGVQATQAELVRSHLRKIDDFAANKSDQFYRAATAQTDAINHQLALVIATILLLSVAIVWGLTRGIRTPLDELTEATGQFRQGKLNIRSAYVSGNEFGTLSASFNAMANSIESQVQTNRNAARLADAMLCEEELHAFCRELLRRLSECTSSQVGAVYLLDESKAVLEHCESIGLGDGGRTAFSATDLEGELGAALVSRQIQRITDIPADTRFTFAAVSGDFTPREILTIPVLSDGSVVAVISLASLRAYSESSLGLVNDIWSMVNARMNGVLAFREIGRLATRLEQQNHELEAQRHELAVQAGELTEQNAELGMQKRELDEASRLKSAFLSNMSHELRTPLNSVIALSGVLNRRLGDAIPAEESGYLEVIERNGKSLLALINDVLDLSRIEAGHEEISVGQCSIRELAGELVGMVGPEAQGKGITLTSLVADDLPPLASDCDKCRHILQNLVGNAVRFTDTGFVEISARQADDCLYVAVRDTGIGIAADQLPHIFEEFRQVDDGTTRIHGGTGLGLAIAKRYAELLGGGITVESTLGEGSTFTLRLPLALELPNGEPVEHSGWPTGEHVAGATLASPGKGQSILIVEDSEPAIIQLTDILQAEGYRSHVARNGTEALAQIGDGVPDAVILDLMMPEVDGFQVLQSVRSTERTAHLPVLILTAKHVTKEELNFLEGNHIQQLIQKGDIDREGLLAAVARMVATPEVATEPALPPRHIPRSGNPVVLVVEDNPDNMRTAKALLGNRYEILEAIDGQTAVEQARAHQPDLILMDIALPVMDGLAALAAIRADETLRDTPVIAVTASAMKGNREEILAHGFDGYISKPIAHDVLEKTMREFLSEATE
jgi:signal transduction histidine kinase/CheY-like chemotaxis protein/CHASE3 domain sensor protein